MTPRQGRGSPQIPSEDRSLVKFENVLSSVVCCTIWCCSKYIQNNIGTHCAKVKAVNCESVWKVLVGWCQLNILSTAKHSQGPGGETAALELKTEIKSLQRGASNDISSQIPDWQICHTMARRQSYNKFNCTIYPAWFFKCQI